MVNKCLVLLQQKKLFEKIDVSSSFLEFIMGDETYPLFLTIYNNKRTPIMGVLEMIAPKLK